jgi:glycosyltransferase involved in cell wall biosynthesis
MADAAAVRRLSERIRIAAPDVIHGHGAKGAAYARLARAPRRAIRVYTPHGGSLHYGVSPVGLLYLLLERALMPRTDLLLFESEFGRDAYRAKIGLSKAEVRVIHNGLAEEEFEPVPPRPDAADVVFVGELRVLKGVDVLIEALIQLAREGRAVTATIVGDGPDRALFESQARPLGESVSFTGALPARQAFTMGRVLVVPSRAESLPYIVLEAAAAGIPLIATRVGGIPEIFGPQSLDLIAPADPRALARAVMTALNAPEQTARDAAVLRERVRTQFSQDRMVDAGLAAYGQVLAARRVSPGG